MFDLHRRAAAGLLLLALTLCLPQGSLILCAGENGHVALEALCDPGNAVEHTDAAAGADACDCDSDCGPCQDSQVGTELSAGRTRDDSTRSSDLLSAPILLPAGYAAALPRALEPARRTALGLPPDPFARIQAGTCLRL